MWPAFTASVTFELFQKEEVAPSQPSYFQSFLGMLSPFKRSSTTVEHCESWPCFPTTFSVFKPAAYRRCPNALSKQEHALADLRRAGQTPEGPSRILHARCIPRTRQSTRAQGLGERVRSETKSEIDGLSFNKPPSRSMPAPFVH